MSLAGVMGPFRQWHGTTPGRAEQTASDLPANGAGWCKRLTEQVQVIEGTYRSIGCDAQMRHGLILDLVFAPVPWTGVGTRQWFDQSLGFER